MKTRTACLTIVSKNYLAFARVLCDSFLEHHPDSRFFVVLVDELDDTFDPDEERFEMLSLEDIGTPNLDVFPYQYTILELNTAVKPFALKHIFNKYDLDKAIYLDPDILVTRPLSEAWDALEESSLVLTPHMRSPLDDNHSPSELSILQSGTYNLGFVGLKRGPDTDSLLSWWMDKLYLDCVVDIPNGLFVDQKWMDLAVGYIETTHIIRDPSYNVAYWNLHERTLARSKNGYLVDGVELTFFHFSGYNPFNRHKLSKYQDRHNLQLMPVVQGLCGEYSQKLMEAGHDTAHDYKYAFGRLNNGIAVCRAMSHVIRECLKNNISFPSPKSEPDAFCEFIMTPNRNYKGLQVAPVVDGILHYRKDLYRHFPSMLHNKHDKNFLHWLGSVGIKEESIVDLYDLKGHCLAKDNPVAVAIQTYHDRPDLLTAFPGALQNNASFVKYCEWLDLHGVRNHGFPENIGKRFNRAKSGFRKCIQIYIKDRNIQQNFANIKTEKEINRFSEWLLDNLHILSGPGSAPLDEDEVLLFAAMAAANPQVMLKIILINNKHLHDLLGCLPNYFSLSRLEQISRLLGLETSKEDLSGFITSTEYLSPLRQLEEYYSSDPAPREVFPEAFRTRSSTMKLAHYIHDKFYPDATNRVDTQLLDSLLQEAESYDPSERNVNLIGDFGSSTGMGQSVQSTLDILEAGGINASLVTLPHVFLHEDHPTLEDALRTKYCYMGPAEGNVNIIVSNADSIQNTFNILPKTARIGKRNIGYWVWETEELPLDFTNSDSGLDEIWTPSNYSADAIRKRTSLPVHVLPHAVDINEIETLTSEKRNRQDFGLPPEGLLFGYFFDAKSVIERKNPAAVIDAFEMAFPDNPDIYLVLKINTPPSGCLDYELVRSRSSNPNIIWLEETLSRQATLQLLDCLDAYISLHRSEGFGLTIAEAMALGKPVIATNYSGNTDFMGESNSLPVDYEVITTARSHGPYPAGTRWANPDIHVAADHMKSLISGDLRTELGKKAKHSIKQSLQPEVIAATLHNLL